MASKSEKQSCAKPGCKKSAMKDGSALCYAHNPEMREKRKAGFVKRGIQNKPTRPTPERSCSFEGCHQWPMKDGSGFCYAHNPAKVEKHLEWSLMVVKRRAEIPPERKCRVKGCQVWTMEDGSGLCYSHHPDAKQKRRRRMLGNKYSVGRHMPWLGIANIEEARGLLFYSLETDQPLLTLRALTKIASLHHLGQMTMPEPPLAAGHPVAGRSLAQGRALAEEYKAMFLSGKDEKREQK